MDIVTFELISCDLRFFAWTLTLKVGRQPTSSSAIFFLNGRDGANDWFEASSMDVNGRPAGAGRILNPEKSLSKHYASLMYRQVDGVNIPVIGQMHDLRPGPRACSR